MDAPEPIVSTAGKVSQRDVDHARDKTEALFEAAPRPVIKASLRLVHEANPRIERPNVAEATLDVSGRIVRAHVAAPTMSEATDLLAGRLRRQLHDLRERMIERSRRPRGDKTPDNEWRHGDVHGRPAWSDRPDDDRDLVRSKTFALDPVTPDEAAFDMEMLHHDFYLFTNVNTDEDNLLAHAGADDEGDPAYELLQLDARDDTLDAAAATIKTSDVVAPEVDTQAATEILTAENVRFLFFKNADTGRGNVVYHRFDGHYGLITPAD